MTSLYFTDKVKRKLVLFFQYRYPHLITWAVFLAIVPMFPCCPFATYSKLTKKNNLSDPLGVREICIYYEVMASSPGGKKARKINYLLGNKNKTPWNNIL